MAGLNELGAAAWAGEQVFNTCLAEQRPADAALLAFTEAALAELGPWVDALGQGAPVHRFKAATVQAAADAMSAPPVAILPAWSETTTEAAPAALDALVVPDTPHLGAPTVLPIDLPSAEDLDFTLDLGEAGAAGAGAPADAEPPALPEVIEPVAASVLEPVAEDAEPLSFDLDLRALDEAPAPAAATPAAAEAATPFDMFATMPYPRGTLDAAPR